MSEQIIILGDMHIGARNASLPVANFQIKFFTEQLFPFMQENNITKIFQLGDVFDVRKFTNHSIFDLWKTQVFDEMIKLGIEFYCLVGNHDSAFKNTINVNSPDLLLKKNFSNVKVFSVPTEVVVGHNSFLFIPWICQENEKAIEELIKSTAADVCLGHFEFKGYEMHKGQKAEDGMDIKGFEKFKLLLSGHFHTRNLPYVGTPYEMSWIDFGDAKGFHVLNSDTLDIKFIKNKKSLFKKFEYDDACNPDDYYKEIIAEEFIGTYAKIVVVNKKNLVGFDLFINKLDSIGVLDLKIVEDISSLESSADDEELKLDDTKTLLSKYIDTTDFELDKERLKNKMIALYVESINILE